MIAELHPHWLIVGSGPSSTSLSPRRLGCRVVAVSTAIEKVPDCDVWVFKDRHTPRDYGDRIRKVLDDGREVVTSMTIHWLVQDSRVFFVDTDPTTTYVRGRYCGSKLSGPMAICWAINHGAKEIDIVGFEGKLEYQDGILGGAFVEQARILRSIAVQCSDITFRYHGELTWSISGSNVELVDDGRKTTDCGPQRHGSTEALG